MDISSVIPELHGAWHSSNDQGRIFYVARIFINNNGTLTTTSGFGGIYDSGGVPTVDAVIQGTNIVIRAIGVNNVTVDFTFWFNYIVAGTN